MASGGFIHKKEARDSSLNSMTIGHILAFDRLVVHADDWGRFYGSPREWKKNLFSLQEFIGESVILAIQHDLSDRRLIGFYVSQGIEYCVVYRYLQYQQLKTSHVRASGFPSPPREMWPLILHPRDTRKNYDCPDIPYVEYDKVCGVATGEISTFPPSSLRPDIMFESSVINPFGGVVGPAAKSSPVVVSTTELPPVRIEPPREQVPEPKPVIKPTEKPAPKETDETANELFGGEFSAAGLTPREKEIYRILKVVNNMTVTQKMVATYIRPMAKDFPDVDILDLIKTWAAAKATDPVTKKGKGSRPWAQIRDWAGYRQRKAKPIGANQTRVERQARGEVKF